MMVMGRVIEVYCSQEAIDQRANVVSPQERPLDTDNLNWQTDYAAVTAS
jgi:hypothetical protein